MPSWSMHLAIAKKVNEKLQLNNELFLYGNLIPDVDKKTSITRYNAHFYNPNLPFPTVPREKMIDIDKFLEVYMDKLNNPLILGYYAHLLTDQFYNERVYTTRWVQDIENNIVGIKLKNNKILKIDIEDKANLRAKYKHYDFEFYGKYLFAKNIITVPTDVELIKDNIQCLNGQFLTDDLVEYRIAYLKKGFIKFNKLSIKEKIFKHNYNLFTKKELDELMNNCIDMVIKKLEGYVNSCNL